MVKDRSGDMLKVLIGEPSGLIGLLFIFLALANVFFYSLNLLENPESWNHWSAWIYLITITLVGGVFLGITTLRLRRNVKKFTEKIIDEMNALINKLENIDGNVREYRDVLTTSEFGLSNVDIEILNTVRESGGFIPILLRDFEELPFSSEQIYKSMAKLALLNLIALPKEGLKIVITSQGLDKLSLPRITFTSKIPEDLALMLVHAELLYREGKYDMVLVKCNNILERAFKVHLIPTIDNYAERWNKEKVKNENNRDKMWRGNETKVGLNALLNFYTSNTKMDDKIKKFIKESFNYIVDVRSRYAHDKPSEKYEKDAYRILKLTELILGMLFEDFKENLGIKSEKLRSAEKMVN